VGVGLLFAIPQGESVVIAHMAVKNDDYYDDRETVAEHGEARPQKTSINPLALKPGVILGRYEIIETLDDGGMGVVYRAKHTALGKIVALKVVSSVLQNDPRSTERFLREMLAIGRLAPHPHVLNAYDAGSECGVQFIATELIEGIQLGDLIRKVGPLSVSEACRIIAQTAMALEHLRQHDLVHRDIKPSNLMLTKSGNVKVVDMGLALLRDEQAERITLTGEAMGSIDYMAPEQWHDAHGVDWRSDVYSLGCTFYYLLAGHAPFGVQQKGSAAKMRAHIALNFPDIRELRGDVPDDAALLLASMVEKDPERRFTDLLKLGERLEAIVAGDLKGLVERGFSQDETPIARAVPPKPFVKQASAPSDSPTDGNAVTATMLLAPSAAVTVARKRPNAPVAFIAMILLAFAGAYLWMISGKQTSDIPTTNNLMSGLGLELPVDGSKPLAESTPDPPVIQTLSDENTYIGHDAKVTDLIFVTGTNRIASVSDDGVLCLFDLATPNQPDAKIKISELAATSLVHDPSDHTLTIVDYDGNFQIRSADNGELINTEIIGGAGLTSVARIPGERTVIASDWDGKVREFDLSTSPFKSKILAARPQVIYDVAVSADGALFAWSGRDSFVSLWRVKEQVLVDLIGHEDGKYVYDLDFSPNGTLLASAGQDNSVVVWDVVTGKIVFSYDYIVPQAVCFLPDGNRLAIGGRGENLQILDLKQRRRVAEMSVGKHVESIAISADGNLIAAGANDGVLKVWSLSMLPD